MKSSFILKVRSIGLVGRVDVGVGMVWVVGRIRSLRIVGRVLIVVGIRVGIIIDWKVFLGLYIISILWIMRLIEMPCWRRLRIYLVNLVDISSVIF